MALPGPVAEPVCAADVTFGMSGKPVITNVGSKPHGDFISDSVWCPSGDVRHRVQTGWAFETGKSLEGANTRRDDSGDR
jgi:hypothetical protein